MGGGQDSSFVPLCGACPCGGKTYHFIVSRKKQTTYIGESDMYKKLAYISKVTGTILVCLKHFTWDNFFLASELTIASLSYTLNTLLPFQIAEFTFV